MKYFFLLSHFNNSVFYSMHSWTRVYFLLNVHLLVFMMQILIRSVCPIRNIITKKSRSSKFWKKVIRMQSYFNLLQLRLSLPNLLTLESTYILHRQVRGNCFPQNYVHILVLLTRKFVMLEWNSGHWKLNRIVHFGHLKML